MSYFEAIFYLFHSMMRNRILKSPRCSIPFSIKVGSLIPIRCDRIQMYVKQFLSELRYFGGVLVVMMVSLP